MNTDQFTIGIIGLGLIGGSIAKTIRRVHPKSTIYGYDKDKEAGSSALKEGVLNRFYDEVDPGFGECDILFLCAPVSVNIEYLKKIKPIVSDQCLITDVGSVKTPMQNAVRALDMEPQFIGGHPMVGSEQTGYENADDRLLENSYYFLTPSENTLFHLTPTFSSFIQSLGALVVTLRPEQHDYITASLSHVPHIIAAELVHLVRRGDSTNGMLRQLAAGGFKDITRIASSSPVMWENICLNNSDNIQNILSDMVDDLQNVIKKLEDRDGDFINEYFKTAGEYRDSVPDHAVGLFEKVYKIYIDIPDEPGTIATVTSQLAFNHINIKNVGIVHNREFEEGVLEVVLYDDESCVRGAEILRDRNYKVHIR